MPEWLRQGALVETPLSFQTMALRLVVAAVLGGAVAVTYRLSHGRLARDAGTLVGTLVLLTILLAMVTMVIGDSVARAFGLVGALSIVRFRTVVDDTRDTAFVIFAVVVGMAVGTGLLLVALAGIPVVGAAALLLSARRPATAEPVDLAADGSLAVRLGLGHAPALLDSVLAAHTRSCRLTGVATARQGAALDLTYALRFPDVGSAASLVEALNGVSGVQGVDLRKDGPE